MCGGDGGGGALQRLRTQNRNSRPEDFSPLGSPSLSQRDTGFFHSTQEAPCVLNFPKCAERETRPPCSPFCQSQLGKVSNHGT